MENKLLQKLKHYGVLTAAITGAGEANAAIIYTDIIPDHTGGVGGQYLLDLNNDGIDDFRIYHDSSYNLFLEPLGQGNEAIGSGFSIYYGYPFALSSGAAIGSSASGTWLSHGYNYGYASLNYGSLGNVGNWSNVTNKYLGLKIEVGGLTYYGWARLDVNTSGSVWTIKDYAYEDLPGVSINAGAIGLFIPPATAQGASQIIGTDIDDNGNGSDLQVNFNGAFLESTIDEYRVMVVKESMASSFDLTDAQSVLSSDYLPVTPTGLFGSTYSQTLANNATDVDGDPIAENIAYRLFVLSKADGTFATLDSLVSAANPVTLFPPVVADGASVISATDIDDNGDGSDLRVDFTAASNESTVSEYRLLVVKDVNATTFNVTDAQAVATPNYHSITASGATNYNHIFSNTATDVDGDAIDENIPYRVFVLSVADGTIATADSLVSAFSPITLTTIVTAHGASQIIATDIDNNGNGTDLQVDFAGALDESTVGEYRVLVVKDTAVASFNLANAQAVNSNDYTVISPSGASNYSQVLANTATDVDGDAIIENLAYRLFVLSIADGTNANVDSLVSAVDPITLSSPVTADGVTNLSGIDVDDNGNGSDFRVEFSAGANESTIGEYRILVVKDASASTFELSDAQAVGTSEYTSVSPSGQSSYSQLLTSTSTDVDGDAIAENIEYRLFVLSIADGTNATLDSLVMAESPTSLVVGINEIFRSNAKVFSTGNTDIVIEFTGDIQEEIGIEIFNLKGQLVYRMNTQNTRILVNENLSKNQVYLVSLTTKSGARATFKVKV